MNLYGKNYRLVFEDNFDAEKLDTDIWTPFDYADNTRDGKKAWRKPENVTLENGNLVIRGKIPRKRGLYQRNDKDQQAHGLQIRLCRDTRQNAYRR